jgi:hypothetical protein
MFFIYVIETYQMEHIYLKPPEFLTLSDTVRERSLIIT